MVMMIMIKKTTTTQTARINTVFYNKVNFKLDLHYSHFNSKKFYSTPFSPLVSESTKQKGNIVLYTLLRVTTHGPEGAREAPGRGWFNYRNNIRKGIFRLFR